MSSMSREELAKLQITLQEFDFYETIKGATLLTETNFFNENNTMRTNLEQPMKNTMQKSHSEMTSMQGTDLFALSNNTSAKMQGTLLSSFVTNLDGKQNSTYKSGVNSAMGDSLAYSNTGVSFNREASRIIPMEVIKSEEGDCSSKADKEDTPTSDDDQDDIDRFEEIDVKEVSIEPSSRKSKSHKQQALLSPKEIAQAHAERENDSNCSSLMNADFNTQFKNASENGRFSTASQINSNS